LIAAQSLIPVAIYLFYDWRQRMSPTALAEPFEWRWVIDPGIRTGVLIAFGQWLLRGSPSLTNWIIREVEGQCAYCSVSLGGPTSSTCPQCGRIQPGRAASATHGPTKVVRTDVKNADQKAT
jgi:hypothetical protein